MQTADGFRMHFLDVGQALSVLVECDGQYMLYDGGNVDAMIEAAFAEAVDECEYNG